MVLLVVTPAAAAAVVSTLVCGGLASAGVLSPGELRELGKLSVVE